MINLRQMIEAYREEDLTEELAAARVCQDIVLKAIAEGTFRHNVTIKGGVVMRSLTQNNRRATRDIDLDFIHYPLSDEAIEQFVEKLNCISGIRITREGGIKELKHQDYHGKSIDVVIRDEEGNAVRSKIDIGVHKHTDIKQEEYCFDVCMDDEGASLLRNTAEQAIAEKLRSLLIFGANSRRYRDIFDMYYLQERINRLRLMDVIKILIIDDAGMRENTMADIVRRVSSAFQDEQYLTRVSSSRQRWIDEDIHVIADGILGFLREL